MGSAEAHLARLPACYTLTSGVHPPLLPCLCRAYSLRRTCSLAHRGSPAPCRTRLPLHLPGPLGSVACRHAGNASATAAGSLCWGIAGNPPPSPLPTGARNEEMARWKNTIGSQGQSSFMKRAIPEHLSISPLEMPTPPIQDSTSGRCYCYALKQGKQGYRSHMLLTQPCLADLLGPGAGETQEQSAEPRLLYCDFSCDICADS